VTDKRALFAQSVLDIDTFIGDRFMFVTPAYAQTAGGSGDLVMSILPFVLMFIIFYFLLIRPQRQAAAKRTEMLNNIRRNDTIITGGGVVAKVTKVIDDNEVEVEIAKDIKVKVMRAMIADVRVKGEPAK
jgi:preprotein translocase subunit YajC